MAPRKPESEEAANMRLDMWLKAVKEVGFPIVISGALLAGVWAALTRLAEIGARLVNAHATFLDVQVDQTRMQTENSGKILDGLNRIADVEESQVDKLHSIDARVRENNDILKKMEVR